MKSNKTFTKTDLFVLLAIVIIIFFIVCSIVSRMHHLGQRVGCASQLRGLGNATGMYHNDFDDKYPIVWTDKGIKAGFGTGWYNAKGENKYTRWHDTEWKDWDKQPTVGGCLYLLVKYEDVVQKTFMCFLDEDAEYIDLGEAIALNPKVKNFADLNDFQSGCNLSYSMNDPWENLLDASSPSEMPYIADQSNKFDTETFSERAYTGSIPNYKRTDYWTGKKDKIGSDEGHGNSNNHDSEGQNVLFADGSVEHFETPTVGIDGDNIYTRWDESASPVDKQIGKWGQGIFSADVNDAYLGN